MKKFYFLFFMSFLFLSVSFGQFVKPDGNVAYFAPGADSASWAKEQNVTINKVTAPPVIDGAITDAAWSKAVWHKSQVTADGDIIDKPKSAADLTWEWKAVWDDEAMYVMIHIVDDTIVFSNDWGRVTGFRYWHLDCMEFYLLKDALFTNRQWGKEVLWYNIMVGAPVDSFDTRGLYIIQKVYDAAKPTTAARKNFSPNVQCKKNLVSSTEMYIEMKLMPWSTIFDDAPQTPAIGATYKIDFMYNENDNPNEDFVTAGGSSRDVKSYFVGGTEPNSEKGAQAATVTLGSENAVPTSSRTIDDANEFVVYPNPNRTGMLHFNKIANVQVYSISGQLRLNAENVKSLNVSSLSKGIYFVKEKSGAVTKLLID